MPRVLLSQARSRSCDVFLFPPLLWPPAPFSSIHPKENICRHICNGSSPLPRRHPAEGLAQHGSHPGDHVLQNQDIPPEWKTLCEMLDVLTCRRVGRSTQGASRKRKEGACPALRLCAGMAVLQEPVPEVPTGWSLETWVGASWTVLLIQYGPAPVWSSEAVWNNVPAPLCGWHCRSILDRANTESIRKIVMFRYLPQIKLDWNHCVNPTLTSGLSNYQQQAHGTGLFAWAGASSVEHHDTDTYGLPGRWAALGLSLREVQVCAAWLSSFFSEKVIAEEMCRHAQGWGKQRSWERARVDQNSNSQCPRGRREARGWAAQGGLQVELHLSDAVFCYLD